MKTISREEFEKIYGTEALNNLGSVQQRPQSPLKDAGIGFAKGLGESATETANMFVEGGRMIQAGLNPNETYGEMSQRLDTEADASPAWVNPFSGQTEENRREMLKSDNKTQTFGKGIAFGAEMMFPVTATAKALSKGDEAVDIVRNTMRKADIDTPKFPRQKVADFVNKHRADLSDIDPQYETVLKQQENPDKMLHYFDVAEARRANPDAPMATTIASKRGVEAYDALATGMQEAGSMKGSLLDSIADVKIGGNIPGRSIDNVKSVVESRYGMTIDNKGNFTQMDGRIAKLDEPSQKLLQDYITELRSLGQSPTARQLDDWVDKMQAMLYKQSSPNLYAVADDPVISFLKGQTGEINGQLKNNVDEVLKAQGKDPAYGALNDQYARLINAQKDLNKALGTEGDKGASLMKSLFSPQTGERTRRLFQTVQDETGINLFEEATLAKFAMESVGDPSATSLLKQMDILHKKTGELDLMKPMSWVRAAREGLDLDGKKLGEQIIKQNLDEARKLTPAQETGLQKLSERLNESSSPSLSQNKQAGFFKLPFTGKINSQTTPAGVAKLMDDSTFDGVTAILEDIPTAKQNPVVNRFLDDMNLSKASDEELEAFLKEVTNEYEVLNPPKPLGKAKGVTPNLVEEAKKYDSVDEFVKAQGEPVYHGTGEGNKITKLTGDKAQIGNRNLGGEPMIYLTENNVAADWFSRIKSETEYLKTDAFKYGDYADTKSMTDFKPNTLEVYISPEAKIKQLDTLPQAAASSVIKQLREEGYQGVTFTDDVLNTIEGQPDLAKAFVDGKHPKTTLIFDSEVLKTKAQLAEIYKEAHK